MPERGLASNDTITLEGEQKKSQNEDMGVEVKERKKCKEPRNCIRFLLPFT